MNNLLDILFRFPSTEDATFEFVSSVLNLISAPAVVVDRKMQVRLANLQAQDILVRSESESKPKPKTRSLGAFPDALRQDVRSCLRQRRAGLVTDFRAPGLRMDHCDVLLCPGQVQGVDLCFGFLFTPSWGDEIGLDYALEVLLESINGSATYVDSEMRFQKFNRRYLASFELKAEELRGVRVSELNPSRQARVLEDQMRHLMATNKIRDSKADSLTTAKRGIVVTPVKGWPVVGETEGCQGLFAIVRPSPVSTPLPLINEKAQELFGKTAITHGPPMFFTQLDGKIIATNAAGMAMMTPGHGDGHRDLRSALPWGHPEMVERLYREIESGSDCSAFLTDIKTPGGTRTFMVKAYGLKEFGDITSEVLVHVMDVTEAEHSRKMLAEITRRLSTEKEILDKVMGGLKSLRLAYAVVDRELTILRVSDQVLKSFDKAASFFVGRKVYEIDPSTRESGIVAYIKTAIDRGQDIRIGRFSYTVPGGEQVLLALGFHPTKVDGKEACLVTAENLTEQQRIESDFGRISRRMNAMMADVDEAVVFTDLYGLITDVSPVTAERLGRKREDLIGLPVTEIIVVEETDLIKDFMRRAIVSGQPVRTGRLKFTSEVSGFIFLDISYIPLIGADGKMEELAHIVRYQTELADLEKQVEQYTNNLERLVSERTAELSSSNQLLEATVERLASMARSGTVLSSLKDTESVMASFLKEVREVLAADFVSVALLAGTDGTSKTTYYSTGSTPPSGEVPSDVVEKGLARLALGRVHGGDIQMPRSNVLVEDFAFSQFKGLLLAWKEEGEFTLIDSNLSRLLCTQLSFSLPITAYVTDLRLERDRSQVLRRIAFRTAGSTSVAPAIRVVAEELTKVIRGDRFFWLVSNNGTDMWLSEIYRGSGLPVRQSKHLGQEHSACLGPVLKACHDSHRLFCDRFPRFGKEGFSPDDGPVSSTPCPFVRRGEAGDLAKCLKGLLRSAGFLSQTEGALAVAPVTLSRNSWGMLCAYNEVGTVFTPEDLCFMCLAASTVGHMWQAADASSSVRRLEAKGETVSELAHDLKYPLMKIRDSLARISCCDREVLRQDGAVREMEHEVEMLNLLTQELIDISNRKQRKPEILDVSEILDYCISITSGDALSKSIDVRKHVDSVAPPIFANKKDVKNVLINILANCIDAAGEEGWVDIGVEGDGSRVGSGLVAVLIKDSGPGVGENEIGKIFDLFYSTKEGGSGVGLFSAKRRANANGGDVLCEIGPEGKSRFVVCFPQASG